MAFFRGPNIVTDGLVLYSDPANPKSNEGGIIYGGYAGSL